jgi:hypothetical protein
MKMSKKNINGKYKSNVQSNKEHKIVIIGDSHARGCASNVKHNLKDNFKTSGNVKLGANIAALTSPVVDDLKLLTKKDIIVFWGGTNDVSKNSSQDGLKHAVNLAERNSHTNIIVMRIPQ